MRALRAAISWIYFSAAFFCTVSIFIHLRQVLHYAGPFTPRVIAVGLIVPAFVGIPGLVMGITWWTTVRNRPSARAWGIGASLMNIAASFFPVFLEFRLEHRHPGFWIFRDAGIVLVIGVVGLVAFARRYQSPDPALEARAVTPIPGDGTVGILNKGAGVLVFALSYAAYLWWLRWRWASGYPRLRGGLLSITLVLTLIGFVTVVVHELGHTITGMALGMKLRAFVAGPFQWHVRSGRWSFQINLKQIFAGGGATGVVPVTSDFSTGRHVAVAAAGPLINLLTGWAALWIALHSGGGLTVQNRELLALFGAFSLTAFVGNFLPLKIGNAYTDGARIYQFLSGGPWGDFHKAVSLVTSSLVTPLRPRDYDIQAIERAARGITSGHHGLMLRFYAYGYYLDRGQLNEAGQALREAEAIYHASASDIPAPLYTIFVFGSAYVLRDAVAARQWWERMELKKPTHFNVDYWRAKSALLWIEGNLKEANEAWEKSDEEAQKLPSAGAYEDDRHLCALLRKVIDASATA